MVLTCSGKTAAIHGTRMIDSLRAAPFRDSSPRTILFTLGVLLCSLFTAASPSLGASVAVEDAKAVATRWIATHPRPLENPISQQVKEITPHNGTDGTPAYFVVSLEPSGFVILPADDLVQPVICFSATGTFDPSEQNNLVVLLKRDMSARISQARTRQKDAIAGASLPTGAARASARWNRLRGKEAAETDTVEEASQPTVSDVRVPSFVGSRWNQGTEGGKLCYNYYTPNNYVCGCVATAMAQVMRFHQYPTAGVGTKSYTIQVCNVSESRSLRGGDGAGGAYDWANMVLDPNSSTTDIQRQAIGALCHDAGVSVGMDYCSDGSGADTLAIASKLKSAFGYANAIRSAQSANVVTNLGNMANANLDAGFPVVLGITNDDGGGHAIVADGYGYDSEVLYHHLNMGWSGSSDAWYNLPDIGNYDTVYKVVYNIYPTGTGEIISGRVTTDAGVVLGGAVVTATTAGGTTYTDTTDERGIYALAKVPSSTTYTVAVTYTQYAFTSRTITTGKSTNGSLTAGNVWGVNFAGTYVDPCPLMYGDSDFDGDVDQDDYAVFQTCLTGSTVTELTQKCACFDRNDDSMINTIDLTVFRKCITGAADPLNPPAIAEGCER